MRCPTDLAAASESSTGADGHRCVRLSIERCHELLERARQQSVVVIEKEHKATGGSGQPVVPGLAAFRVLLEGDEAHARVVADEPMRFGR